MVFIVMGVSGCGKTTVGAMLAGRLGLPFHDADDFHTQENINKMKMFLPLSDEDRMPWLFDLAIHVAQWNRHTGAVLACSALKEKYREILTWNGKEQVCFILLRGDRDLVLARMGQRAGHFFPPELLDSQFRTLEEPADAIAVSIDRGPEEICECILEEMATRGLLPPSFPGRRDT